VIAEGIENRRDLIALQEREVDFGQGYLLGRSALAPVQPRRLSDMDELRLAIPTVGTWDGKVRPPVASGE
jgi:EAL domain-containing protein (putative c-di-GMP-specific phosphodiesterase class I)